jgi:hypothetical protein
MLEDERMSSDSGEEISVFLERGVVIAASFSWWVTPTARERPSAVVLRSGEE